MPRKTVKITRKSKKIMMKLEKITRKKTEKKNAEENEEVGEGNKEENNAEENEEVGEDNKEENNAEENEEVGEGNKEENGEVGEDNKEGNNAEENGENNAEENGENNTEVEENNDEVGEDNTEENGENNTEVEENNVEETITQVDNPYSLLQQNEADEDTQNNDENSAENTENYSESNVSVVEVEIPPDEEGEESDEVEPVDYDNLSEREKAVEDFRQEIITKLRELDIKLEKEDPFQPYQNVGFDQRQPGPKPTDVSLLSCLHYFTDCEVLKDDNCVDCYECTRKLFEYGNLPLEPLIQDYPEEERLFLQRNDKLPIISDRLIRESGEKKKWTKIPLLKRISTKQILITSAPKILTIHLKRFYFTNRGQGVKISTFIPFPLELELSPYILSDFSEKYENPYEDTPKRYSLYGVCNHSGGLNGGHYTAFTRIKLKEGSRGDWYYISDQNYHQVRVEEVLKSSAYLLFYELIDNER